MGIPGLAFCHSLLDNGLPNFSPGGITMARTVHDTWSPEQYAQQARFVSDLGMPVVELLAPRAGERILDLGCGDGSLTKKLVELGCQVGGVDASPAMVAAAQALGLDA